MSELTGGRLMFQALIEVPFGTVLFEEIAFRSVLLSMLIRREGLVFGVIVSSLLFGLWHILPSIGTHEQNPALGSVVGGGLRGNILAVALSVLTTSIAGVLFYSVIPAASGLPVSPDWALGALFGVGGFAGMYCGARLQKYVSQKFIKILLGLMMNYVAFSYIRQYFT